MILVNQIRLPLSAGAQQAIDVAVRICRVPLQQLAAADIAKISVDARHGTPTLVYTVALRLQDEKAELALGIGVKNVTVVQPQPFVQQRGTAALAQRPVVCGFGPAGIFAALLLAQHGFRPIVLERGGCMQARTQAVAHFNATGQLDVQSNIQFGEGGAGAFSDGKLTTRIHDPLCSFVTDTLLRHGAPAEIAVRQKPHIGTDMLRGIITSIRQEILSLGGQVLFDTPLTGIKKNAQNRLTAVCTPGAEIPCSTLLLCVGHSARDTVALLQSSGVQLAAKPFSVGFRAEHLQTEIDKALYHSAAGHPALPVGEYQLSQHVGARCVYTFCMCPGGSVVAGASEENHLVTNGMSQHARNGKNANAAVVVSVSEKDFDGDANKAIAFQRRLEAAAYTAGGGAYVAPAQDMHSFLQGTAGLRPGTVQPTYPRGVTGADLGGLLGSELADTLRAGLRAFGRKLPGYTAPNAILTGLETRTSSPVRMARTAQYESPNISGLYPCGEGAGYAGGIVSAAVDGLKVASALISRFAPAE